jgi:peptidoglycan/xylan/chitin deacetylase (PgdA/CDA1 family)
MIKKINFTVTLILFVAFGVGIFMGIFAGSYLFDLAYPETTVSDTTENTADTESSSGSETSNQTTSSADKPIDPTPTKKIALTFDDGPSSAYTGIILDLLEQYDAQATFFVCGSNVTISTRTVLRRAISLGCEIGNHTLSHKDMKTLSKQELLKEILDTNEKIALHSGTDYQCKVYRPPYGNINLSAMNTLYDNDVRMYSIHWSSDSLDWEYQSRYKKGEITREAAIDGAFQTIVNETGEGTVILMHDIHEITPDILKLVLEKYTAEGYTFVTVSELFGLEDNAPKEAYFKRYRSTSSILDTTK